MLAVAISNRNVAKNKIIRFLHQLSQDKQNLSSKQNLPTPLLELQGCGSLSHPRSSRPLVPAGTHFYGLCCAASALALRG